MAKKKSKSNGGGGDAINTLLNVLFWGGVVIVAYILFSYATALPIFSGSESNTYTTDDGVVIVKTNLGNLFAPYIAVSDIQNNCFLADGDYVQSPDKVGCWNTALMLDAGDCVGNVPLAVKAQCEATHAKWVCDTHNIGCLYE